MLHMMGNGWLASASYLQPSCIATTVQKLEVDSDDVRIRISDDHALLVIGSLRQVDIFLLEKDKFTHKQTTSAGQCKHQIICYG